MSRCLVIAPHPDDELIGCYSLLQSRGSQVDVTFAFSTSELRYNEAKKCAGLFGHTLIDYSQVNDRLDSYSEIYVPSLRDTHPEHKAVNLMFRCRASHFYSVDMVAPKAVLPEADQRRKRDALNECYPSQRLLWDRDAGYYLFESVHCTDYSIRTLVEVYRGCFAEVPEAVADDVRTWSARTAPQTLDTAYLFNRLVAEFGCTSLRTGTVTFTF